MTVLDGPLPTSVEIGGREAPVNSDYRVCLRILEAFEDDALADAEKQAVMLSLLYPAIPADRAEACRRAVWFLNGGEEDGGQAADAAGPRRYSFTKDARFIFTGHPANPRDRRRTRRIPALVEILLPLYGSAGGLLLFPADLLPHPAGQGTAYPTGAGILRLYPPSARFAPPSRGHGGRG